MSDALSEPQEPRPESSPAPIPGTGTAKKRRRGSRGGRNRSRTTNPDNATNANAANVANATNATANGGSAASAATDATTDLPDPPREGRPSPEVAAAATVPYRPKIGDTRPARAPAATALSSDDPAERQGDRTKAGGGAAGTAGGAKKRRRRGGRGRGKGSGGGGGQRATATSGNVDGFDDLDDLDGMDGPLAELDEETLERRRGRERKGRPVGRYLMAVHVRDNATQIAVLEGRNLIEHYVSRPQDDVSQIDGNVYLARVQNVLPGMEAAFVDIGTPKNAVLYRGDVRYDSEDVESGGNKKTDMRIEQMLRQGQSIVCQVTKNPIGTKGARLTQEVSLPGRFVVLIPNSDTYGISKRLTDDERKRLRKVLDEVKPAEHGVIVRTAAEGATADELRRDVLRLVRQWQQIDGLAKRSKAPALLYREPDMAVRVIREEFNKEYRGVVIDHEGLYEEVREYVESISPELADRVERYDERADGLPIFERYHVHEQLHKALDRKVWLPSGGSLIIERTEALTVIDVNTGKNVGTSNLEETVFRNNLEAAEEIARQLRLRDIGGIIVIDFIDMEVRANRDEVVRKFRDALARDKTRTQVFDISELGLVEMTRKRISEGLVESFSRTCPECGGRGLLMDDTLL
jgi:ribonuclease E